MKTLKYEEVYRTEYRSLKRRGLRLASSWRKSTTASACTRHSVIVRHWSSSATCGVSKLSGEDEHEFSEAWGIYRSDELA
jgi:hypothetical protein